MASHAHAGNVAAARVVAAVWPALQDDDAVRGLHRFVYPHVAVAVAAALAHEAATTTTPADDASHDAKHIHALPGPSPVLRAALRAVAMDGVLPLDTKVAHVLALVRHACDVA